MGAARIDYSRYQSAPNDSDRLLRNVTIKRIVQLTEHTVNNQKLQTEDETETVVLHIPGSM
jgi:hypothetical protein